MRRDFWCLFQAQLVSNLGTQAFQVMALYYLASSTGSPGAGAAYLALGLIPPVVVGPWLAAWATRFEPRTILVACDTASGCLALPMLLALLTRAPSPVVVATLLATVTLLAVVNALLMPTLHATVPRLVPAAQLSQANSLIITTQQLAAVAGQGLGGALYALAGPAALCIVTCASFLGSAAWASRMRDAAVARRPEAQIAKARVFSLLRTNRPFRRLALTAAIFNALYAPWLVLLPFHLAGGGPLRPEAFGVALAAYGLGNVAGAFVTCRAFRTGNRHLLSAAMVFQAFGLIALGVAHAPIQIDAVLALMGAGIGLANVQAMTRAQTSVPSEMVSQATAVLRSCVQLATPIGFAVVALSRSWLGAAPGTVFEVCGAALIVALAPNLRQLSEDGRGAVTPAPDSKSTRQPEQPAAPAALST